MNISSQFGPIGKIFLNVPLLNTALALICGILAARNSWIYLIPGIFISISPLLIRQTRLAVLCLFCVLTGSLRMDCLQQEMSASSASRLKETDIIATVTGSITRLYTSTAWIETDDAHEKIEVLFPEGKPPSLGEQWEFQGLIHSIAPPRTPGAFDRQEWLERNGIACRLEATEGRILGPGNFKSRTLALSGKCRDAIAGILSEGGTRDDIPTQIMISMLLGDKSSLSSDVMDDFRTSGSLHIFAVSGLHVGLVASIILFFLYLLPIHPIKAKIVALILLALYVFITGMPVSAIRAYIMISLFVTSLCLRRKVNPINTLSLAGLIVLSLDPRQIYDPGFQLSFLIFGTIVLVARLENRLKPWWSPDPFIPSRIYSRKERFLVHQERNLRILLAVAFASWLVSIPITSSHFGTFNMYSTLANLLMAPFLAPLMVFSMMSALAGWFPPAAVLFNACARIPASILLTVSQFIAGQPHALMPWASQASPMEAMALSLPGQGHCIVLGNPGILINCGNEYAARQIVTPALRTCGFVPHCLIPTQSSLPLTGGRNALCHLWPGLKVTGITPRENHPISLRHARSGQFTIYPANSRFSTGISADHAPVILWEYGNKRLLYIGDSPMSSLLTLPGKSLKADILLIGRNAHDPVNDPDWIQQTGAGDIVFLREEYPEFSTLPSSIKTHHLTTHACLQIRMQTNAAPVKPWHKNKD